jgi:hypothetical protein
LYRRDASRDASALDDAVRHAIVVAKDVAGERRWWKARRLSPGGGNRE